MPSDMMIEIKSQCGSDCIDAETAVNEPKSAIGEIGDYPGLPRSEYQRGLAGGIVAGGPTSRGVRPVGASWLRFSPMLAGSATGVVEFVSPGEAGPGLGRLRG